MSHKSAAYTYSLFYSVYHLPVVCLIIFIGILSDVIGPGSVSFVFSAVVAFGQNAFNFGLGVKSAKTMIAGRFLVGLGGEALQLIMWAWVT